MPIVLVETVIRGYDNHVYCSYPTTCLEMKPMQVYLTAPFHLLVMGPAWYRGAFPLILVRLSGSSKTVLMRVEEADAPPRLQLDNVQRALCSFVFRNGLLLSWFSLYCPACVSDHSTSCSAGMTVPKVTERGSAISACSQP
ncbi:hypothetical protein CB1_001303007 [Camelus ferus]|nr:hypothetical protein CB1_001303007 [Camelus ferus]